MSMKRVRFFTSALLSVLCMAPLSAQTTGTVRGRVIDAATQQPIVGATVTIGPRGAQTQANGRYTITGVPAGSDSVRARMIGYAPVAQMVNVPAGQTTDADLALSPQAVNLSAIVVTGYGEQRAGDITGAVTQLTTAEFNPGRVVSPAELIQSKVAGVQVVDNNEPGGGISIRIRGTTSINASSEPLYVIDGIPVGGGSNGGGISAGRDPLNFLNPDDIDDITVLRDASAAAIYGANGASGVILITTKRGHRGAGPQFEYSTSFSASSVTRLPDMLNAAEYRAAVTQYAPQYLNQLGTANTNWFDQVTRTGYGQAHNLSVSGAGDNNAYRLSFGYLNQDGIIQGSTVKRYSLGVNLSQRLFHDRVDVRANLRGSRSDDQFTPGGYGLGGVLSNAAQYGPTQPVRDSTATTGYYNWPGTSLTSGDNPVEILNLATSHGQTYRSIGNMQVDWHLPFLGDALAAHVNVGYDVTDVTSGTFGPSSLHAEQKTGYFGELASNNNNATGSVLEAYLTYAAPSSVVHGQLDLTAGYSYAQAHAEYASLYERGLASNLLGTSGVPSAQSVSPSDYVDESRLISFFGRANYNISDKYLLSASLRRDGSSRFGPNNAWGVFPSAAFAWRISKESFMQSFRSLSDLKLRLSWARTGNQAFANYLSYAAYTYSNPQGQVQFGNQFVSTIRPAAVDPNIKWESTGSVDVGLDWGFNNQRVSGTIDWYDKKTDDMIFQVPVAGGSNLSNYVTTNIGSMRNRGIEASLRARLMDGGRRGFTWNADFTISHNKNTLLSINPASSASSQILVGGISGGVGNTVQVLTPGVAVNSFFLCRQAYGSNGKPIQGSYLDSAGTAVVTQCSNNRVASHDPNPSLILGHSSYMTYRSFDFGFTLRAYLGNYVYNNVSSQMGDYRELFAGTSPYNLHRSVLTTGFTVAQYLSDYYLEKASFLRMDNLTVGYTFNYSGQPVRVYGTIQNVFTTSSYTGVDPTAGLNGIDNNIYPRARTFTGGMSVRF
jgi:TonB-linked SusC/RagA family outer membrane protein